MLHFFVFGKEHLTHVGVEVPGQAVRGRQEKLLIRRATRSGTGKFPYPGAIDADGHGLEPPDLWEKYIDPQFRDRAIRLRPNKDGLEMLEIGGRPSKFMIPGGLTFAGAMGKPIEEQGPSPERTYANTAPFGAMDPQERLARASGL